jgi:uncharacterized phage protein (TIGR01671 family)
MKNREIKFRAWINGQMVYDAENIPGIFCGDDPVMQFAGLKDKNGKEIYEGDIYTHNGRKFLIKYSDNQFVLLSVQVDKKTNWRSLMDIKNISKYIDVIGNIYKNPELL